MTKKHHRGHGAFSNKNHIIVIYIEKTTIYTNLSHYIQNPLERPPEERPPPPPERPPPPFCCARGIFTTFR